VSGGVGTGGESTIDQQTMNITLGSQKPLCEAPFAISGCGQWKVNVGIPPELLVPGVLELGDSRLVSFASYFGPDRGDGTCHAGAGSYFDGTIEIVSIDAERIVVRLSDTWTSDFDANGEHTAERCN
jgi:hypothetical protein